MAEYLCEEDMSTGEYISRDVALRQLNATCLATDCDNYNGVRCRACAYADAMDFIDAIPAADVQPVNQWISVKERQPDKDDLYLVAVENEICVYMDIADYSNNQWHKHDEVIYWQPLPELPKEG